MRIPVLTLLHVAIGVAGASALIIASTHLFWTVPLWAGSVRFAGTTAPQVYSLLRGGMQPVSAADVQQYHGMLLAAIAAAGIGFNVWLAACYKLRRQNDEKAPNAWKLIPLLLLVPCVVHFVGYRRYSLRVIAQNQAVVDQYRLHKKAAQGN